MCDQGRLKSWDLRHFHYVSDSGVSGEPRKLDGDEVGGRLVGDTALEAGFVPTALAHPPTYLNKVVIGSERGALQLWNVRTGR